MALPHSRASVPDVADGRGVRPSSGRKAGRLSCPATIHVPSGTASRTIMMRLTAAIALALAPALAASQAAAQDWFTIYGYPELPETDVIQISPGISSWQDQVAVEVRTTRKAMRTGYGGVPYRSYQGLAAVDCNSRKGWFLTLSFYTQPAWQGTVSKTVTFKPEEAPMIFSEIPGAPAVKLITAACAAVR
ncbi:hypothetical protein GT347_20020 [Xylophilus rhododendri]|uniref:Surface-adhesin protein E-like domain-containing protein n=1 Tax=Xylophilus rhododendri TaxID=2697032 RepID=A0A857JA20_9BURK|nr:surface-adhesin E family protein [Xylophilus rhododendri]QHJ00064.1 hypothetical protein GT347_20020 [Xylophilus rhododendri]